MAQTAGMNSPEDKLGLQVIEASESNEAVCARKISCMATSRPAINQSNCVMPRSCRISTLCGPCCRSWRRSFRERVWIRTDRLAFSTLVPLARFQGKTPGRPKVRQDQSHSRPRDICYGLYTKNPCEIRVSNNRPWRLKNCWPRPPEWGCPRSCGRPGSSAERETLPSHYHQK